MPKRSGAGQRQPERIERGTRDEERIAAIARCVRQMWMIRCPRYRARAVGGQLDDLAYLHPAVQHVQVGRAADEPKSARRSLDASEPSEEEEQVADPDLMPRKVCCCRSRLPEYGPPSTKARERIAVQVGIEMCAIAAAYATAGELLDHRRDRLALMIAYFVVAEARGGIGNR